MAHTAQPVPPVGSPSGEQATAPRANPWQIPRVDKDSSLITGVASGIARELGVQPIIIRASFGILTFAGGWGLILYGIAWLAMTLKPGTAEPVPRGANSLQRHAGVGFVVLGMLLFFRSFSLAFVDVLVWPASFVFAGALIAWSEVRDSNTANGALSMARLGAGLIVTVGGVLAVTALSLNTRDGALALIITLALVLGVGVVAAPSLIRLASALDTEHSERVRGDEKARVAAHLHDSVLQTLTLIQRHADDPQVTAQLARRQERELRSWLYGPDTPAGSVRLSDALRSVADQIEGDHRIPVEVVVVGDVVMELNADERFEALLGATREAMTNAAKHSGAAHIDVFAELIGGQAEVFIRDTGKGFDVAAVPSDRKGLSESIHGRMERHGGTATVHTVVDEGTEIELCMPLTQASAESNSESVHDPVAQEG